MNSGTSVKDLMIGGCANVEEEEIRKFVENSQIQINLHFETNVTQDLNETVWSYTYPTDD